MRPRTSQLAVGIDFGGTAVKMGLVDSTGAVRDHLQFPTAEARARSAWLTRVAQGLDRFRRNGRSFRGIGGGVAQSGSVLFRPLRAHLKARLQPDFAKRIRVIPARLGETAGLIGCATLVFKNWPLRRNF